MMGGARYPRAPRGFITEGRNVAVRLATSDNFSPPTALRRLATLPFVQLVARVFHLFQPWVRSILFFNALRRLISLPSRRTKGNTRTSYVE